MLPPPPLLADGGGDSSCSLKMFRILGPDPADCGVVTAVVADDDEDQSPSIAFEALRLNCSRKLSICTSMELGVLAISFLPYSDGVTDCCNFFTFTHPPTSNTSKPPALLNAHVCVRALPLLRIGLLQL